MRLQKQALTPEQIERASLDLTEQFCNHPLYREAKTVYAYLSYNQEVRTDPLIARAWKDGKTVAVPKIINGEMVFLLLEEGDPIEEGYKGIPEPKKEIPACDPTALVLLPGLAFDPQGHRLGYGGGFYDRFLAKESHPTIALCFDFQMLEQLDFLEEHDIPADVVLSAKI
ncbi:MAG: 5-formyltetrahydrofolate cyclo-ligase [Oscillospiraceae bacterium]|nr:5-formyltetrahydrofolate cyclo-ligase [Oscillospiraceae bacterium]